MIPRTAAKAIQNSASQVPVVTVLGPRQSGKTTLVRHLFTDYTYVNLEEQAARQLAESDPVGFFSKFSEPIIIDEVQRVPQLLSSIQVRVDENRDKAGRFILTGSHQPRLKQALSQSLAGRTTIHTLLPLSIEEVSSVGKWGNLDDSLVRGFMPELYHDSARDASAYYRDYLETYIEKDLRQMIQVKNLNLFVRFLTLLAGRVGQVVNLASISGEVGVSSTTLGEWLSVLEDSYVVFRLPPYFSNISKRIVKSPKVYFVELGLAAYLLGIETATQASRDPLRGNLFENMVVLEAYKARLNDNKAPNLFYLRTEKGLEIDMILKKEGTLHPFEIKSSMTPNAEFARNLKAFTAKEANTAPGAVVYAGEPYESFCGTRYINYAELASAIRTV